MSVCSSPVSYTHLYPLLSNGTCRFIVFDFDNHKKGAEVTDFANTDNEWHKDCLLYTSKMSHLEQRELQCSEIELSELVKKIEAEAAMLSKKESKLCKVERVQEQNIVKVDEELVMEVTDNLLENAVRYAQKSIALQIKKKDGFLIISVEDDGIGFVDTEEKVTEPFYHKNPQDDLKHFGLGMYISRIFCEKHGGNLKIYNARQGGAHVEALFKAE